MLYCNGAFLQGLSAIVLNVRRHALATYELKLGRKKLTLRTNRNDEKNFNHCSINRTFRTFKL